DKPALNTPSTARSGGGRQPHQTRESPHHRGQVTTLFSQLGIDVGVTDLSALIPECADWIGHDKTGSAGLASG
ncbi:hypothetical protein AB7849_13030, partial [Rhodanobacter sp. 115]